MDKFRKDNLKENVYILRKEEKSKIIKKKICVFMLVYFFEGVILLEVIIMEVLYRQGILCIGKRIWNRIFYRWRFVYIN